MKKIFLLLLLTLASSSCKAQDLVVEPQPLSRFNAVVSALTPEIATIVTETGHILTVQNEPFITPDGRVLELRLERNYYFIVSIYDNQKGRIKIAQYLAFDNSVLQTKLDNAKILQTYYSAPTIK